jgi:glycosyltransferase involved in cell wall biosynthesis
LKQKRGLVALQCVDLPGGLTRSIQSPITALETDAASPDAIPAEIRAAADSIVLKSLRGLSSRDNPDNCDGVITWLAGERILYGSVAQLRHCLRVPGRSTFVAVHTPYLEDIPLLSLQRRWFRRGREQHYWNLEFRIESGGDVTLAALEAFQANTEPWAQLALGVFAEKRRGGDGIAPMVALWERAVALPNVVAALALRNLTVLMVRHGEPAQASQFLTSGLRLYPDYAELYYLAALLAIREGRSIQAPSLLEKARSCPRGFLGSGGESTYRVDWLIGVLAARVGNDRVAFHHLLEGIKAQPVFLPAARELLKLRVSSSMVELHQSHFCAAARREPVLMEEIFEYLLLHRQFAAAERIARTVPMGAEQRSHFEKRLSTARRPFRHDCERPAKAGVLLQGPFLEHSSLARINREVAASLLTCAGFNLGLEPSSPRALPLESFRDGKSLLPPMMRHPARLDLTIRHHWPPDLEAVTRGKLAAILPWEYGAVPLRWVSQIQSNVDELWVPSHFVRNVFLRAGVDAERIHVVPNGVDQSVFKPQGDTLKPPAARSFVFLFVGGALRRKGVDLLLKAYRKAFEPGEDVTLLLVLSGTDGAYRHNSLMGEVFESARDPNGPQVIPITETVDDAALASLYRGSDAFVLPYRGEGFGMPLLEAMACGKPVITTAEGPSLDFCSAKTAFLIRAVETQVSEEPPPLGEFSGPFTWLEPDFAELVRIMRYVYDNRDDAGERGRAGVKVASQRFTWSHVTSLYRHRIVHLANLP